MTELLTAPAWPLLLAALLLLAPSRMLQRALVVLAPLAALWLAWSLDDGVRLSLPFLGHTIEPVEVDGLRRVFASAFAMAAFAGGLFALGRASRLELSAAFAYAGSAIGICFAGDLITLFVYWELMALFSTLVVAAGDTEAARAAALRYLLIHLLGGVLLMAGIAGVAAETGSIDIRALALAGPGAWLLLAGVLVNAAAPPFSAWLPDAYPEASPSGTVFLSAFTTKAAVLALLLLFPGTALLVWIGLLMALYGVVYALIEDDARRLLAYSIMSQVGFMVAAAGVGSELAIQAAAAHAFAHIAYKALLLMSTGAVLWQLGTARLSELGGLGRRMPFTAACGLVGALAISAWPLTSGFVSKSMITQAVADAGLAWPWLLLTAASAGTVLYAGLRLPLLLFVGVERAPAPAQEVPWSMRVPMLLLAAVCIVIGVVPGALYALVPGTVDYVPYTLAHVWTQLEVLAAAGLAFVLLAPWLRAVPGVTVDSDWLWRRGGAQAWDALERGYDASRRSLQRLLRNPLQGLFNALFRPHGPEGILARTWPTGSMLLWVVVMLALLLVLGAFAV